MCIRDRPHVVAAQVERRSGEGILRQRDVAEHVLGLCRPRKYQHDEVFCYISTPWGEYEKIWTGFTGRDVYKRQSPYFSRKDMGV